MPGRIVMDAQDNAINGGLNKDHDRTAEISPKEQHHPSLSMNESMQNGNHSSHIPLTNGDHNMLAHTGESSNVEPEKSNQLPPELEHFVDSYVPFGKLLERIAQQAYFELNETIDGMADMVIQPQVPAANGVAGQNSAHAAPDSSKVSVEKKIRLMEYAQTQKDRFIKALVLADWGKNMDDMNKLIELTMWLRRQDEMTQAAADGILGLKHNMIGAKMPNPNIEGALELLSTGKAPWMPDLGYIPPKPLTAQKLLQTLKDLDFVLSIRLNLHEEIPPHFRNYTIANGRVTFEVAGEFQVDLATTDEEKDSPFYFIDMRFLFSPASSIKNDALRFEIEGRVNEVLASKGLQGCYDWLHNFVLTYKLNALRAQAVELSRNKWHGCISIQPVHRSLVIQYWMDEPRGKNWFELGISNEKRDYPYDDIDDSPRISCRLFQQGQEITDHKIELDTTILSMERILNRIVAYHTSVRLKDLSRAISAQVRSNGSLVQRLQTSDVDPSPECCYLALHLRPETRMKVFVQPINGQISFSPATTAFHKTVERALNTDPSANAGALLSKVLCTALLDQVRKLAMGLQWTPVQREKQSNTKMLFRHEPTSIAIFRRECWGKTWALAATVHLNDGLRWWIVELSPGIEFQIIASARPLLRDMISIDRVSLVKLEKIAIARISNACLRMELQQVEIKFGTFREIDETEKEEDCSKTITAGPLYARSTSIMGRRTLKEPNKTTSPCFGEVCKITHEGFLKTDPDSGVVHCVRGVMQPAASKNLIPHLKRSKASDMTFESNGVFEATITSPLGAMIVPTIRAKLQAIERLCSFVRIARKHHFGITWADPTRIAFCYSSDPPSYADVTFPDSDGKTDTVLRLTTSPDSTQSIEQSLHRRISTFLQNLLSAHPSSTYTPSDESFDSFCRILSGTLPLLRTLTALETADPVYRRHFTAHGAVQYRLIYSAPLPSITFSITTRTKDGKSKWHVEESRRVHQQQQQQQHGANDVALRTKLREQVWDADGTGWMGIRNSAVADTVGIADLLSKIDDVVSSAERTALPVPVPVPSASGMQEGNKTQNGAVAPVAPMAPTAPMEARKQAQAQAGAGAGAGAGGNKKGQQGREIVVLD